MTDEDILLEYEATLAFNGEALKTCPKCDRATHRRECPTCEVKLTGDRQMDEVMADIEAGADIDDLDALLRPGKQTGETFETVKPGDLP